MKFRNPNGIQISNELKITNPNGILFSSSLDALAHHPVFHTEIDMDSLLLYFTLAYVPTPRTIWKNARKLPPGHWLLIENNQVRMEQYWEIRIGDFNARVGDKTEDAADTIHTDIRRAEQQDMKNIKRKLEDKGKNAITNYKTLEIFQNLNLPKISFIECQLETGRTHQIRVHMNFRGNPILGDKSYGKSKKKFKKIDINIEKKINNFNRQALHAKSLGFVHPGTGKEIFFEAERPKDFDTLIKNLKKASI